MYFKQKKKLFITIIAATFFSVFMINSASSTAEDGSASQIERLKTGDPIPIFKFEDIDGKQACNDAYKEWIIVYSFSSRKSNDSLQKLIGHASRRIVKEHPELKIAYVNFADLMIIPGLLKGVVAPILRFINDSNNEELKKQYKEDGLRLDKNRTTYYMVPDWNGEHLKTFGLKDAGNFHCFITYKYQVKAVVDSTTQNLETEFNVSFNKIAKTIKELN